MEESKKAYNGAIVCCHMPMEEKQRGKNTEEEESYDEVDDGRRRSE